MVCSRKQRSQIERQSYLAILPAAMNEDEISRNQGKKMFFKHDQTSAQEIFHLGIPTLKHYISSSNIDADKTPKQTWLILSFSSIILTRL